jgi:hypothetical protein
MFATEIWKMLKGEMDLWQISYLFAMRKTTIQLFSVTALTQGKSPFFCIINYFKRPADPSWGTAYPLILWYMFQEYGDYRLAEQFYPGVKACIYETICKR